MSRWVRRSAVAVRATMGVLGKCVRSWPSWVYSGRKSWPQLEMQWASSMAKRLMLIRVRNCRKPSLSSFSGDT